MQMEKALAALRKSQGAHSQAEKRKWDAALEQFFRECKQDIVERLTSVFS